MYDIPLQQGRAFSRDYADDPNFGFIVNEALVKELGLENPVGAQFGFGWYNNDTLGTIIGVTHDFNFNSLHHSVNTLALHMHPGWGFDELSVKISPSTIEQSIGAVQATWERLVPDRPFEYEFLDEHFESLYEADEQMSSIASIVAILAIIIACLGLFGLASIATEQRTKEIGIRKVLGASLWQLLVALFQEFCAAGDRRFSDFGTHHLLPDPGVAGGFCLSYRHWWRSIRLCRNRFFTGRPSLPSVSRRPAPLWRIR